MDKRQVKGGVVLLKDSQTHSNEWQIRLVVKTLPSSSNKVRNVAVLIDWRMERPRDVSEEGRHYIKQGLCLRCANDCDVPFQKLLNKIITGEDSVKHIVILSPQGHLMTFTSYDKQVYSITERAGKMLVLVSSFFFCCCGGWHTTLCHLIISFHNVSIATEDDISHLK